MRAVGLFLTIGVLAATPVLGGTDDVPSQVDPTAQSIPQEEWRRMVRGRTVTYRIGPDLWAYERYAPRGNGVEIQLMDGTCMTGRWTYKEGAYCFNWNSELNSCFQHLRTEDEILIVPIVDGESMGAVQTVSGISDLPITCGPTLSS